MKKSSISYRRWTSALLVMVMVLSLLPAQVFASESSAAVVDFGTAKAAEDFALYSTSAGGFAVQDGMLVPTGDAGEFKAIYKDGGKPIRSVSVEIHPVGNDGVYGGLYINARNASNGQDMIDALYLGIESNFPQNGAEFWEDAPNRIDIVLGQFAQGWVGFYGERIVSETGLGNNLFSGGNKEPLRLRADLEGNVMNVTLSLVSNPGKQVTTTYVLPEGTDLTLGDVGIRSQYNNATYDNFTVEYAVEETVEDMPSNVAGFENTDAFRLYSTSAGGFAAQDGKLVPSGDVGEFKAIYNGTGKVNSVSVELHPVGNDGPIYAGLYLGASNANDAQDSIDALYIGIESHFTGWDDAANRIDLVVGKFLTWTEYSRTVSETGNGNNLFSGGIKEPIVLKADMIGNMVIISVSLLRDPSVSFGTTYVADRDLSLGQVGIRSHHNNTMFDNFTVNGAPDAPAAVNGFDNTDGFDLYSTSDGGFAASNGKLVPFGNAGEFKAVYQSGGKTIHSVSVEMHPQGTDGPIYGGLYIGASNAENAQDSINALYIGIESHFTGWDDAANRVDLVVGKFPTWAEYSRTVSETGLGNNLFSGGVKQPLLLRADISGNTVTVTVSLLNDPSKSVSTVYTADWNLSLGQVGIRSHHNNAMYDNFAVNAAAVAGGQGYSTVSQAVRMAGENVVTLLNSSNETISVFSNVTINLAGHHLTNVIVAEGCSLKLIDTTTDVMGAGGFAIVSGNVESMAQVDGKTYIVTGVENLYTSHCYLADVMQQVSLGDDLAMKFSVLTNPDSTVNVIFGGETIPYELSTMAADENGRYNISVDLAAAQMTEEITLEFVYGGAVMAEKTYSVRSYAEAILTGDYPDRTVNLVKAMLNYGAKAQLYFGVNTDNLADADYEQNETSLPANYEEMAITGSIDGLNFYGASLVFKNKIAVRFYFTGSVNGVSFGDYEVVAKDGMYYVEVPGINPQDYAGSILLTAAKGTQTLNVSYSPLNYIIRMSEKGSDSLKALLNALYGYHTAAMIYVNENAFFGIATRQFNLNSDTGACTGIATVSEDGIAYGYISDFEQESFYFESRFHIDSALETEQQPKFGLFAESGDVRQCFYVDMTPDLKATGVGSVTAVNDVYDWANKKTANVSGMAFSGNGETVTLGILKNGSEIRFYVNGVCALTHTGSISGAASAGVFGFNTGMTLSQYFTKAADLFEQEYIFKTTKTYCNGQDIAGQWGAGTYTNGGQYGIGDPFVMRYDGKYYMYPSSGTAENGVTGIKVFVSDDLVNWTYKGFALKAEEADQAYAPEVIYYNGWFYMCQSGNGGSGHYIYKSQSPIGPFEKITNNFGFNIDGSIWVDDNGEMFFLYAKDKGIRVIPMDESKMRPVGQANSHKILNASLDGKWVEGPGLFRRGDYLYLTYSGNKVTDDNYRIGYSYLEGSDPMGDFIQPENNIVILETGPDNFRGLGHNSNVVGPNLDSWYAAYHNLVNVDGPQRRYMLDKLVTNGGVVMANGPTYFNVPVPERPDFETRGTAAMVAASGLFLSGKASETVYTAEFNFTPQNGGVSTMIVEYADKDNYCEIVWNDSSKTLTANAVSNGKKQTLGSQTIDFLSAGVLHTVRVEQGANRLIVYMDSMRKIDVEHTAAVGQIGVTGAANWGYMAFANHAFGTGDFETVKIVGGSFPAVHYLKGENRGFCIANAKVTNGIRQNEKENTVYDKTTGSYDLKLDTAGDWVKYAIRVSADGQYDLSAYMSTACAGTTLQITVDGGDAYEFAVPASDAGAMADLLLGQLNLTAGNHTLKVCLVQGSLQVQTFTLTAQ